MNFVTTWVIKFYSNSNVWVLLLFEILSFVAIWVVTIGVLSFVTIWVLSFVTIQVFALCHNLGWVLLLSEFCHNLSFWVRHHFFFFFSLGTTGVLEFSHNLGLVTVSVFELSQFEFCPNMSFFCFSKKYECFKKKLRFFFFFIAKNKKL